MKKNTLVGQGLRMTGLSLLFFFGLFSITLFTADNFSVAADSKGQLSITFYAKGTIKGYSYPSKMKVYIDGEYIGESGEKDQKKKNKFNVMVPTGSHRIKCQVWALYKGEWQERTVANDYSFDWAYNETMSFAAKNKLVLEMNVTDSRVIRK